MAATDPKKQGLPDLPNVTGYTDKNYAGGQMDEFGFTETIPGSNLAPYQQFQADRITRQRQEGFFGQAEQAQREGLGNLSTYRPGGAAALTSPYYQNMSNVLVARANAQYSPDLMHYWRWNQAHRARKAYKRAQTFSQVMAAGSLAASLMNPIGSTPAAPGPGQPPSYGAGEGAAGGAGASKATGGLQTQDDLGSGIPGASGSQGLDIGGLVGGLAFGATEGGAGQAATGPATYGATQGAPGVSRGTGGPQTAPAGGGGAQRPQPGAPGQPPSGSPEAAGLPMAGGGLPPTEHPLGFQFGMAANLGTDVGLPNDQMLAMTMVDEDIGGPNGMPMLDFAELQLDQMFFTLHEILQGDPSLGGYG